MDKPVILFYSHQSNLAGAPLSLATLASHLSKRYRCIFVTPTYGPVIDRVTCPVHIIGRFFQTGKISQLIRDEKVSIVHANTILATPAVAAAKKTGTKVVWHIREDLAAFPKHLPAKITRSADVVIIISDSMKKFFPSLENVIRVYNGIPQPRASKRSPTSRIPTLVFAGTIEPRKGVKVLLEAAAQRKVSKFKIDIYGEPLSVTKSYYHECLKYVDHHDLKGIVTFKGVSPKLIEAIQNSEGVIIPSLAEPFGRVAVEAMACKKPVIASDCGGLSEIVQDGKTGFLFPVGDSNALSERINLLLSDRERGKKMGRAGYLRYKQSFTIEQHVAEIEKIYKKLLHS